MRLASATLLFLFVSWSAHGFIPPEVIQRPTNALAAAGEGFGVVESPVDVSRLTMIQVKTKLLDLLPKMMGTPDDFKLVETYVNALEEKYAPPQTLDFLNLAMGGDWQLVCTSAIFIDCFFLTFYFDMTSNKDSIIYKVPHLLSPCPTAIFNEHSGRAQTELSIKGIVPKCRTQ